MITPATLELAETFAAGDKKTGKRFLGNALLTKGDGTGALIVPNAPPRTIYVRRSDTRELFTCYLPQDKGLVLEDGHPEYETIEVRVGYEADSETPQVLDTLTRAGQEAIGVTSPMEAMIYRALYAALGNIGALRARPTSPVSQDVAVDGPYWYKKPSTAGIIYYTTLTVGSAVATAIGALTSGQHQLALVYLDKETGSLGLSTQIAVTAAGTVPSRSEFGTADVQAFSLGATWEPIIPIYLYYGQPTVTETDIYRSWDLRQQFSSVGLVGYRDVIDTPLTIGANHQMTFSRRLTVTSTLTVSGLLSLVA